MSHHSSPAPSSCKTKWEQSSGHQGPVLPHPLGFSREALSLDQDNNRAVLADPSQPDNDPSFDSAYYFYHTGSEGSSPDTTETQRFPSAVQDHLLTKVCSKSIWL